LQRAANDCKKLANNYPPDCCHLIPPSQ